jgi:poly-gamma-glutamate synthesis protein (capsule biosynthesis protein)
MKKIAALSLILPFFISGCSSFSLEQEVITSEVTESRIDELTNEKHNVDIPAWKKSREDFKIIFTGDVMLGRYVETLMNRHTADYPFEKVSDRLNLSDKVVINLEGPVVRGDEHIPTPDFSTNFSFHERVLDNFSKHNINIVNLANNHTFDKGEEKFKEMTKILSEKEIEWFGHPWDYDNMYMHSINANGVKVNLLGYHQATNNNFDIEAMKESISTAVRAQPNEIYIANFHFGPEYILTSSNYQKEIARASIDAGADMVIGHHPHVTQEMEVYKGKPIFYSLGNFVFDQYFSQDTQSGLAVELNLKFKEFGDAAYQLRNDPYALLGGKYEVEKIGLKMLPIKSIKSQPEFLGDEEYKAWIEEFANKSQAGSLNSEYFYEWSY